MNGLPLPALAELLGVHVQTIRRWRRLESPPLTAVQGALVGVIEAHAHDGAWLAELVGRINADVIDATWFLLREHRRAQRKTAPAPAPAPGRQISIEDYVGPEGVP